MNRPLAILVLLLALLLSIAGCGGGNASEAANTQVSTNTQLTKRVFIQRAMAICKKAERKVFDGVFAYEKENPSAQEEEMVRPVFIPVLEEQVQKLRDLGAPRGDQRSIEAMMVEFELALEKTKEDPGTVLNPSTNPFKKYHQLADKYGLVKCDRIP